MVAVVIWNSVYDPRSRSFFGSVDSDTIVLACCSLTLGLDLVSASGLPITWGHQIVELSLGPLGSGTSSAAVLEA